MTHNPYVPISQTPWWCVNGHYNAHERAICRYCDVPFTVDQRSLAPDVPPPAADSRDTEARPPAGTPAAFRYALDNDLAEMREQYSYRSDGDGFWIVLLIDEVESLRAKLAASVPEDHK